MLLNSIPQQKHRFPCPSFRETLKDPIKFPVSNFIQIGQETWNNVVERHQSSK